ncbi:MAG: hypothetical protein WA970_03215, partial [Gammaproteobacteria bacterium]
LIRPQQNPAYAKRHHLSTINGTIFNLFPQSANSKYRSSQQLNGLSSLSPIIENRSERVLKP